MIELGKENNKIPSKDKCEYCEVIPVLTLLGVYHHLPLLHMTKTFVYMNSREKCMNQFAMGYMVNPTLYVN